VAYLKMALPLKNKLYKEKNKRDPLFLKKNAADIGIYCPELRDLVRICSYCWWLKIVVDWNQMCRITKIIIFKRVVTDKDKGNTVTVISQNIIFKTKVKRNF
jgi:hypothetical protein